MTESVATRTNAMADRISSRETRKILDSVQSDLAALTASVNTLITNFNAHVHSGVTAGTADSGAPTAAATAAAVSLNTTP